HEHYIVIAFDESDFLGALLEDFFHARTKTIPGGVLLIDLELAVVGNLDDHGFVFKLDVLLLVRRGLWNERVQALRNDRRNDHENNNQNKKDIDQRHHIGRRERSSAFSSNIHPHSESPVGLRPERVLGLRKPRRVESGAALRNQQTNGTNTRLQRSSIRGRWTRSWLPGLSLLGEPAEFVD